MMADDEETARLRELVERPERRRFWGHEYTITPRLIAQVIGDGKKLLSIQPLATRPNYFVIRVDTTMVDPRDPFPASGNVSLLEDIMCAAEEEYGYLAHADEERRGGFPDAVDWGIGCTWGEPLPVEQWRPAPLPLAAEVHPRTGRQRTRALWRKRGRR